jgi:hypothetical protein
MFPLCRLRQFWLPQTLYFKNTVKCNSIDTYLGSHAVHEHNTRFLLNSQVKHMRGQAGRVYMMLQQKCQTQGTSDVFRIMLSPWSWASILWWFGKVVLPPYIRRILKLIEFIIGSGWNVAFSYFCNCCTIFLCSNARAFTYLYISYHDIYKLPLQRTGTHLVFLCKLYGRCVEIWHDYQFK